MLKMELTKCHYEELVHGEKGIQIDIKKDEGPKWVSYPYGTCRRKAVYRHGD